MHKQQFKSQNMFQFDETATQVVAEDYETQMGRLFATAMTLFRPVTDKERYYAELKLSPYPGMNPASALQKFRLNIKNERDVPGPSGQFESLLVKGDVEVRIDCVAQNGVTHVPSSGTILPLTPIEQVARDCSNILSLYTQNEGGYISNIMSSKQVKQLQLPVMDLTSVRKYLAINETEFGKAKDEMYAKMILKENLPHTTLVCSQIYAHEDMKPFRRASDKILTFNHKWFADGKVKTKLDIAWEPCSNAFKITTSTDKMQIWKAACISTNVRGGTKKKGSLSIGYMRFDISPFYVRAIDEMTDILSIYKKHGFEAVTLICTNYELAKILIKNSISVYCAAMSSKIEVDPNVVGLYQRGKKKSLTYYELTQTSPTLSKYSATLPDPVVIMSSEPTVQVTYLPLDKQPGMRYLPSIRAAEGVCLVTNIGVVEPSKKAPAPPSRGKGRGRGRAGRGGRSSSGPAVQSLMDVSLDDLYARFSKALSFRNMFIYSRATFISNDPYRNYFSQGFIYPQIKPNVDSGGLYDSVEDIKPVALPEEQTLTYYTTRVATAAPVIDCQQEVLKKWVDDFLINMKPDDIVTYWEIILEVYDAVTSRQPAPERVKFLTDVVSHKLILQEIERALEMHKMTPDGARSYLANLAAKSREGGDGESKSSETPPNANTQQSSKEGETPEEDDFDNLFNASAMVNKSLRDKKKKKKQKPKSEESAESQSDEEEEGSEKEEEDP